MSTQSQINANRENAQSSTGPRTAEGKAVSSKNRLAHGLFTRQDYVKPEERDFYKEFSEQMYEDLLPVSHLEETFVGEIIGASWRLRRCANVESELEAWDDSTDKTRRSIDRARAAAHNVLSKSINHLRKLQTERVTREQLGLGGQQSDPLAESKQICQAVNLHLRNAKLDQPPVQQAQPKLDAEAAIAKIMNQSPDWAVIDQLLAAEKKGSSLEMASNCKTAQPTSDTARNAPCPCRSGEKFKRCCGKNAPPLLSRAA